MKDASVQRQLDAMYLKLPSLRDENSKLKEKKNFLRIEENKLRGKTWSFRSSCTPAWCQSRDLRVSSFKASERIEIANPN
jgi:hypothetical protein